MIPSLKPGATLAQLNGPVIETERLILRPWRGDDIAPNTAMLSDPDTARFITADGKPVTEHWTAGATQQSCPGTGCCMASACSWSRRNRRANSLAGWARGFRRAGRALRLAGVLPRSFAARAMRWKRRGRRSTGHLRPSRSIEIIHCIDRENTASQAVARRLGAEIEGETELFGHVADVWVTRRGASLGRQIEPADNFH